MSRFVRRVLPTVLVAGTLGFAFSGVLSGGGDHVVPGLLMLSITGASAVLYRYVTRPRHVTTVLRAIPPRGRSAAPSPTQRSAPHCVIPAPRPALDAGPVHRTAGVPTQRWGAAAGARGGVRHCVVPRGELPHQRRASDGS